MTIAYILILLLAASAWLVRWRGDRLRGDLDSIARNYGLLAGFGIVAALAVTGRLALAAVVAVGLLTLHRRGLLRPWKAGRTSGARPVLRTPMLEVALDGGLVGGRVLKGSLRGRDLNDLDNNGLAQLYAETARDGRSRSALEVYLDRRLPGWREHMQNEAAAGRGRSSNAGAMSQQEAYEILGLQQGAAEADIRAAHRRLMKRVHPDQGGSTFLAVRINQAKDRLLSKHV